MFKIYFHTTDSLEIYSNNLDKFESREITDSGTNDDIYSSAGSFYHNSIDLNSSLNKNPGFTFFGKVKNSAFADEGIGVNDLLIIDRSIAFTNGRMALCFNNGAYLIRRILIDIDAIFWLQSSNESNEPIQITKENKSMIWGIIVHVVKTM